MTTKPTVSREQLAKPRSQDDALRPKLEAEMQAVREQWREYVQGLTSVVSRHAKEIDGYIQTHGPMTHSEVVELALAKLLSEV
jgi:hypothetical protein